MTDVPVVRRYRLAYMTGSGEFGTMIVIAGEGERWPMLPTETEWDKCEQRVKVIKGPTAVMLAITPIAMEPV